MQKKFHFDFFHFEVLNIGIDLNKPASVGFSCSRLTSTKLQIPVPSLCGVTK